MKATYMCALAALVFAGNVMASDYSDKYKQAMDLFKDRGTGNNAQLCADAADKAYGVATTDVEKFDALVLESRCTYFVGMAAKSDDDKVRIFGQAKNVADRAKPLQPNRGEAYYYYAISLGRWAEANGIMKSLGERNNLRRNAEAVLTRTAVGEDGKPFPSKEWDSWGANRTLGRLYFKLPGLFGGDNGKAEKLLAEALVNTDPDLMNKAGPSEPTKRNSLNVLYYAEVLVANNKKAEAVRVLGNTLKWEADAAGYNPVRVPETEDEMKQIRALYNELTK